MISSFSLVVFVSTVFCTLMGAILLLRLRRARKQHSTLPPEADCAVEGSVLRQVWRMPAAGSIASMRLRRELLPLRPNLNDAAECSRLGLGVAPGCSCLALVDVKAIGLNFADIFAVQGLYSATPQGSFIPGLEFAGTIASLEHSASCVCGRSARLAAGDRVMGCTRFGGYATQLLADPRCLRPLPQSWSFAEGASFLAQGLTAFYGLCSLGAFQGTSGGGGSAAKKGERKAEATGKQQGAAGQDTGADAGPTVLIHSAAGGVGLFALELVQRLGGRAIATVGSPAKVDFLYKRFDVLGSRPGSVFVRPNRTFGGGKAFGRQLDAALRAVGAPSVDVSMDSLLGDAFHPTLERVSATGRVVVFGAAAMATAGDAPNWLKLAFNFLRRPLVDPMALIAQNKSLMMFNLIWLFSKLSEMNQHIDRLCEILVDENKQSGARKPVFVGKEFSFKQAPEALRFFQSGKSVGKVVLLVD